MGRGTWSWIVPDGLWEIAEPLIPPSKVRPQGGGTQDTPDETLFAAIIYVLVSGCAWRALPPCFGISKSTAHRSFLIWSRAGVWGWLHEQILHRLDDADLLDLSRAVLDSVPRKGCRPFSVKANGHRPAVAGRRLSSHSCRASRTVAARAPLRAATVRTYGSAPWSSPERGNRSTIARWLPEAEIWLQASEQRAPAAGI